jgi:plasmid replication initiation protein
MNCQNLVVYKSNKVIEAGYKLTLNELRVVLACIGQVQSKEELLKTDKFELSAKDFAACFDISENRAYSELQTVAKRLFSRYVIIDNPDPEQPKLKQTQTHWISSIDYIPDDGKIVLFFAPKILPYLSKLEGTFTKYEIKHIGNMSSTYGIRLYELLMQWKSVGKREIEIAWLKKQFEIEDKYIAIKDLKKYVIDPAVKDINTHSNFTVQWEQRKTGRAVTHLIFTFAEKNPPKSEQPQAAATPAAPPKAATQLTAEQQACFDWASHHPYWQKFTKTQKSFLTCFNKEVEGGLKDQWLDTLPKPAKPKKEKSAAALKREAELVKVNLQNALASLEKLNKLSPNPAIANQIVELKQQLAERMKE